MAYAMFVFIYLPADICQMHMWVLLKHIWKVDIAVIAASRQCVNLCFCCLGADMCNMPWEMRRSVCRDGHGIGALTGHILD